MKKNSNVFLVPIVHDFSFLPSGMSSYCVYYDREYYQDHFFTYYSIDFPEKIKKSVIKRRAEFFAGRLCANKAMNLLGVLNKQVAISPARAPLWPNGLTGSISHTDNYAIAIVGSVDNVSLIGVDMEMRHPEVFIDIADQFTSAQERFFLQKTEIPYDLTLLITFSAKESLYKALWPEVNYFFDFSAAEIINIDNRTKTFQLKLTESLTKKRPSGTVFSGKYDIIQETIITIIAN